jgi:hypothetical protein
VKTARRFSPGVGAPFGTLDHEIFEEELTRATMQRAAAVDAGDFAVCSRTRRRFNPNELVHCCAVRALKPCCRIHNQRMGSWSLKEKRRMKSSDLTKRHMILPRSNLVNFTDPIKP